jgi:hypothetical protein
MKKIVSVAILYFLSFIAAVPQLANSAPGKNEASSVLKDFTRSGKMDGITLNFVLLNDKTVDLLFTGDSKYAIRARASQATTFFVQGVSERNMALNNKFTVEQGGVTFEGLSVDIKNFGGGNVSQGDHVNGLLQLEKKLDLTRPFTIKGAHISVEFKLSSTALQE